MVGLWLIEFLPCLLAIYLLLSHGSASGIDVMALNQAGILAITIGLTSIAIGLYRPEICLQTRRLLVNTAVAALMSFPLALVVGKLGRIDTSFLLGGNPTRPLQVLVVWIVFLYTTRFAFSLATRLNLFARRMLIVGNAQEAACSRDAIRSLRRGFFTGRRHRPCQPRRRAVARGPAAPAHLGRNRHQRCARIVGAGRIVTLQRRRDTFLHRYRIP